MHTNKPAGQCMTLPDWHAGQSNEDAADFLAQRGWLIHWVESSACTAFTDIVDISEYSTEAFANASTAYEAISHLNWCSSFRGYLRAHKHKLFQLMHSM